MLVFFEGQSCQSLPVLESSKVVVNPLLYSYWAKPYICSYNARTIRIRAWRSCATWLCHADSSQ